MKLPLSIFSGEGMEVLSVSARRWCMARGRFVFDSSQKGACAREVVVVVVGYELCPVDQPHRLT